MSPLTERESLIAELVAYLILRLDGITPSEEAHAIWCETVGCNCGTKK